MRKLFCIAAALFFASCNENYLVDAQDREKIKSACGTGYSLRDHLCVRDSDQCPKALVSDDDVCSQLPCNNNLYFDGEYCLASADASLTKAFQEEEAPAPIDYDFTNNCTSATWTAEETYTNEGLIYLGLEKAGLLSDTNFDLTADADSCVFARNFIFDSDTTSVIFPFSGITDLDPLRVFENATNIEELILDIARTSTMSCPLTDASRCKFIPFTTGKLSEAF